MAHIVTGFDVKLCSIGYVREGGNATRIVEVGEGLWSVGMSVLDVVCRSAAS